MHKNRLSRPDLRANAASNVKNCCFLLRTDGELDVARYDCALAGLFPLIGCVKGHFEVILPGYEPSIPTPIRHRALAGKMELVGCVWRRNQGAHGAVEVWIGLTSQHRTSSE